jgi:hypothetical protein
MLPLTFFFTDNCFLPTTLPLHANYCYSCCWGQETGTALNICEQLTIYSKDLESLHRANQYIEESKTAVHWEPGYNNPLIMQIAKYGSTKPLTKVFAYLHTFVFQCLFSIFPKGFELNQHIIRDSWTIPVLQFGHQPKKA